MCRWASTARIVWRSGEVSGSSPAGRLPSAFTRDCTRPIDARWFSTSVARSTQASALGAAIMGAVAGGAFPDVAAAQRALVRPPVTTFAPEHDNRACYQRLFPLYVALHDAFGTAAGRRDLRDVMKELLAVRSMVQQSSAMS